MVESKEIAGKQIAGMTICGEASLLRLFHLSSVCELQSYFMPMLKSSCIFENKNSHQI